MSTTLVRGGTVVNDTLVHFYQLRLPFGGVGESGFGKAHGQFGFEAFSNRYRKENTTYVAPVFAYRRKYGNSITGGYVYRGNKESSFYGVYICGDYTSKRIWGLTQENRKLKSVWQIGTSPQFIASFGTDEQGNIYVVGYEGMVYKIDFENAVFPSQTSEPLETKAFHKPQH